MNEPNVHPSFLQPVNNPKISLHLKSSFLIHIFMISLILLLMLLRRDSDELLFWNLATWFRSSGRRWSS